MIITKDFKMADIIHLNYSLLSIIYRFDIQLGFGDKSVEEVCNDNNVDSDFFLEIVNAFLNKDYFPKIHLKNIPIDITIKYLKRTHEYYLIEKVPEIEELINELVSKDYTQKDHLSLLKNFFLEYKTELTSHIEREEISVFPYIIQLWKSINEKKIDKAFKEKTDTYSILDYEDEHDNVEEKLFDLKNIIIKYLPTPPKSNISNKILTKLFKLEADINDHSRIEDKLVVPMVVDIEKKLAKMLSENKIEII